MAEAVVRCKELIRLLFIHYLLLIPLVLAVLTLVNVYVDLVVFTRIAGTS